MGEGQGLGKGDVTLWVGSFFLNTWTIFGAFQGEVVGWEGEAISLLIISVYFLICEHKKPSPTNKTLSQLQVLS